MIKIDKGYQTKLSKHMVMRPLEMIEHKEATTLNGTGYYLLLCVQKVENSNPRLVKS